MRIYLHIRATALQPPPLAQFQPPAHLSAARAVLPQITASLLACRPSDPASSGRSQREEAVHPVTREEGTSLRVRSPCSQPAGEEPEGGWRKNTRVVVSPETNVGVNNEGGCLRDKQASGAFIRQGVVQTPQPRFFVLLLKCV